jgi:hypothetical protein
MCSRECYFKLCSQCLPSVDCESRYTVAGPGRPYLRACGCGRKRLSVSSGNRDANPWSSRRASSRDGRASVNHTCLRLGVLLQNPNDSSRVNLNRILNQRKRTTYEQGVVVLTVSNHNSAAAKTPQHRHCPSKVMVRSSPLTEFCCTPSTLNTWRTASVQVRQLRGKSWNWYGGNCTV